MAATLPVDIRMLAFLGGMAIQPFHEKDPRVNLDKLGLETGLLSFDANKENEVTVHNFDMAATLPVDIRMLAFLGGMAIQPFHEKDPRVNLDKLGLETGLLSFDANKENEHMVQNQLPPTYQYAQTPGLEEYQQVMVQTPVSSLPTEFKSEQTPFTSTAITAVTPNGGVEQQTQTDLVEGEPSQPQQSPSDSTKVDPSQAGAQGPKRLHVSNIPFRFREADLRNLLGQFGPILDVEIIFNERGSKGFGFVTFQNSADADRAREKLNGTVVEGRKIEVNNATARVMTKKTAVVPTIPNVISPVSAAALRGVALTRGRATLAARGVYNAAAAAQLQALNSQALRGPTPIATATALPYATMQYAAADPLLAAYAGDRYVVTSQPLGGLPAGATRVALPTMATAATYGATAAAIPGRELAAAAADPYLGHSIGPVPGYGATVYRGAYQRFTPY